MSFISRALGMGVKSPPSVAIPTPAAPPPAAAAPTLASTDAAASQAASRARAASAMASGFAGTVTNQGGAAGLTEPATTGGRSLLG